MSSQDFIEEKKELEKNTITHDGDWKEKKSKKNDHEDYED